MKVLVITGTQPHHRHLCLELARSHEIVGVLNPVGPSGRSSKVRKLRSEVSRAGLVYTSLEIAGARGSLGSWSRSSAYASAEAEFFGSSEAEFRNLGVPSHGRFDVREPATTELVRRLDADVTVCLGGPIYPQPFVEAARPMFNFHTGLSPIYNGASTIDFAFANGHAHLCGGTLMTMESAIDGGDVLAHHLPEVAGDDSPATLFMKTVRGGTALLDRFLRHLEDRDAGQFTSARQPPPLFYFRSRDWTLHHSNRVAQLLAVGIPAEQCRRERSIEYWGVESDDHARDEMLKTVRELVHLA